MQNEHQTGNIIVDGIVGLGISATAYFAPKIMGFVAFLHTGSAVKQVDEVVSTVWHAVGAIIAIVTLVDIIYKKYKAYKNK